MTSTCILLIDDHAVMLDGLRMLLEAQLDGARVVAAMNLSAAVLTDAAPDVIVLDIKLSGVNGLDGLASLRRKWPLARIVMLSSQDDLETRRQAMERGAQAFLSKTEPGELIVETVRNLLAGELLPPPVPQAIAQPYLTPRQCEVLDMLNQGLTNKVIAKKLSLSDNTVRRHVQDIFAYFGVASRTEAVFEARRQGLVT